MWILPLAFVLLLALMLWVSLPLWQVFNLDPDYYYLLNGLRLLEGLAPTDLSHPGTPVQVIIALVLRLATLGMSAAEAVEAVLRDPEPYLVAATLALYPFVAVALYVLGRAVHRATGSLWPALLAQSSPFLSMIIPKFGLHAKPEPLLIAAAALLAAAAFSAARAGRTSDRHAVLMGVALGFGIACKVQFAALGLVPLFLLDGRRLLVVYPAAIAASVLVFTAPALPNIDLFLDLWGRILTHSGAYGGGGEGIVDPGRYPRAVLKMFSSKLILSATLLAAAAVLVLYVRLRRRGLMEADPLARVLAGLALAAVSTFVMVAKQPAAHYLVPALMLTGPMLAALWGLTRTLAPARGHGRAWSAVAAVLVLLTLPAAWRQTAELADWTRGARSLDMNRFKGCAKIFYDSASSPTYALQRGDMNAQARYSPRLAEWMPADEYSWFVNDHTWWKEGLVRWAVPQRLDEVMAAYPCVVFRGSQPWNLLDRMHKAMPGFTFDQRCEAGEESVFTKGVSCKP
ncbi:conserved membrane hypothetical protein [Magnetospirillum sp. UT-4]|nr:conserved membrane hypothetical protein [Magnetospirillum sp. UT-4]